MRRVTILWLLFFTQSSLSAASQDRSITFSGEASEGQTFRKSIGNGLDFVLMPSSGWSTGWTIEVSPQGKPSDPECNDFVWVVTPPYRFQNSRYLDTEYGIIAQEAVRRSPREFSFVMSCADFMMERRRVDRVLWPYTYSKQEVDDALAKLGESPLGKGRLWIEDSKITPGHESGSAEELGAIHWIKFRVEITFPAGSPHHPKP
ncbi:MAG: hypothetical protein ABSC21_13090 [Terriglobia bacterium]|jgi:hypothetical protein